MGLFFENMPSPDVTSLLAEAYRQEPPPNDAVLAEQTGRYIGLLGEPLVPAFTAALLTPAMPPEEARAQAAIRTATLAEVISAGGTRFNARRFLMALLLFAALVAGGAVADSAHMTASAAALFAFGGSVFGVVTAFLASEKDT
jgi:hypothetical protein